MNMEEFFEEVYGKTEHKHHFTVIIEWKYSFGDWDYMSGKPVNTIPTSKKATKLKCESCPEIREL